MRNKAIKMADLLSKRMVCFVLFLFLCVEGCFSMVICLPAHFLLSGSLSLCVAQDAGFRDGHAGSSLPELPEHSGGKIVLA